MSAPSLFPILAISGSLRSSSSNTALLRAVATLAKPPVTVALYEELEHLPAFNPDVEDDAAPAIVKRFRERVRTSAGVLISTPEYAHGVPGVLKNALDWLVGSGELVEKPVAILRPSSRGDIAHASLKDTLVVMSARVIPDASVTLAFTTNRLDETAFLSDATAAHALRSALNSLIHAIGA